MINQSFVAVAEPQAGDWVEASPLSKAISDLRDAVVGWRVWFFIGWFDVKQRYRRSMLGPLWMTLNMGVQVAALGFLMGFLTRNITGEFLPWVSISLVTWNYMSSSINDGSMTFILNNGSILQSSRPLSVWVLLTVWKNNIVFWHSLIIFIIFSFSYQHFPTFEWLLFFPGMLLLTINLLWMCLVVAIISTRYRDLPMIISNLFTALFWLTPIFYYPEQMTGVRGVMIEVNPFTHLLNVVRDPLMGRGLEIESWIISLLMAVIGWTLTMYLFSRTRHKIAYWL